MAGFIDKARNSFVNNNVGDFLKDVSSLGRRFDKEIAKNSFAVGDLENIMYREGKLNSWSDDYAEILFASSLDTIGEKAPNLFEQDYAIKRQELRNIATQDIIEDILETISDELIVYDIDGFFCKPGNINIDLKNIDMVKEKLDENFKKLYKNFSFDDDITAWGIAYKWLTDGMISYEIIYDNPSNPKEIATLKEIDVTTLTPTVDEKGRKGWIQFKNEIGKERFLWDSQVIFISYNEVNYPTRASYLERLVKPFNVLKIMETTRVIWAVVNSSFRTKFVIPMGGKPKNQAKQTLAKLMNMYNENIAYDPNTGELNKEEVIKGKPMFAFTKQFWFPSKEGEEPQMETIGGDGPDLSDTESLRYFEERLWKISKIPMGRFERGQGGGSYSYQSADSMLREEIKFENFIKRLRNQFKEIFLKPLRIQMALDFPELKYDSEFLTSININFNDNNIFRQLREMDIKEKEIRFISDMSQGLTDAAGIPFLDSEFLLKKYGIFTDADLKENEKYKEKNAPPEGQEGGGFGF